jgi:predicted PurR-regulated permease PerM
MVNYEMESQEMVTGNKPVAAGNGTYHDGKDEHKAASEKLVSAVDPAVVTIDDTPYLRINVAVGLLAFIAIIAALYLARAFFVPLLVGILASYALSPVVEWMKRRHVPRSLSAALVLVTLVGGTSWIAFSLSDDAAAMIEKLPDAARKLRLNLSEERSRPTALQNMQEAAKQIEGAAADAGANTDAKQGRHVVSTKANEPSTWLRDYAVAQSALLFTVISQAPIV